MSIKALVAAIALSTIAAPAALACGPMPQPERVTGTVDAFDGNFRGALQFTYAPTGVVIVQYPRFSKSGQFLYQGRFRLKNAQMAQLADALRTLIASRHRGSLEVELEQVDANQWRLVSFTPSA